MYVYSLMNTTDNYLLLISFIILFYYIYHSYCILYTLTLQYHFVIYFIRFLGHLVKVIPYPIECVQTDNGLEFTKHFCSYDGSEKPTIFQVRLSEYGSAYGLSSCVFLIFLLVT